MLSFLRFLAGPCPLAGGLLLHPFICLCYLRRWDRLTAITVFPFWAWCFLGMGLILVAWITLRHRRILWGMALWSVTLLAGADETLPMLKSWHPRPQQGVPAAAENGRVPLRIITMNCRAGPFNPDSIKDLIPWQPDIVLLQESPGQATLQNMAVTLYNSGDPGHYIYSFECAVLARGLITHKVETFLPRSLLARVQIAPGVALNLGNVHLLGAETDARLWKKDAFRNHWNNRMARRREAGLLLGATALFEPGIPAIIGGDFNAPAGDAVFRLLKDGGYSDLFRASGSGWPNTYPNASPVLRIDHLWGNAGITPIRSTTVMTTLSDHRMVVCDFLLPN